ncbi:PREDICTED: uncharacterized protein LOC106149397 [Chinchilla lanigera]|uniref:uncharacterized protein LOC106149397 n=1 Tax=Chinchilla lanigera TaxID=34839 RepID=UPI0006971C09|nr:PREDICTED: uncharacterized protein LOC106149397 [Chinchilla lanigera]
MCSRSICSRGQREGCDPLGSICHDVLGQQASSQASFTPTAWRDLREHWINCFSRVRRAGPSRGAASVCSRARDELLGNEVGLGFEDASVRLACGGEELRGAQTPAGACAARGNPREPEGSRRAQREAAEEAGLRSSAEPTAATGPETPCGAESCGELSLHAAEGPKSLSCGETPLPRLRTDCISITPKNTNVVSLPLRLRVFGALAWTALGTAEETDPGDQNRSAESAGRRRGSPRPVCGLTLVSGTVPGNLPSLRTSHSCATWGLRPRSGTSEVKTVPVSGQWWAACRAVVYQRS